MNAGARARLVVLAALAVVAPLRAVLAAPPPASLAESRPRSVSLVVTGEAAEADAVAATTRELLSRIDVRVVEPHASPLLARVAIDLRDAAVARIRVEEASGRVVIDREVPRDDSPAIVREGVAHLAQSAVESLLVDPPPPPPPPAPVPRPPVATVPAPVPAPTEPPRDARPRDGKSPIALDVATFVGGGPVAKASGVAPRVGGMVTLALRGPLAPSLSLGGSYALPYETGNELVTARSSFTSLRAVPSLELVRGADAALDVGLGVGVDLVSVSPRSDVLPTSALGPSSTRADFILAPLLLARLALFRGASVLLGAGLEANLSTREYVVARGGQPETLLSPWRARPLVVVGFSFTALGAPRFGESAQ